MRVLGINLIFPVNTIEKILWKKEVIPMARSKSLKQPAPAVEQVMTEQGSPLKKGKKPKKVYV